MNEIEEIKSKLNIVDIVSSYVPELKKSGVNYFALCPFHRESSPSFTVNENLQIFKCFGCGKGGDIFKFVCEIEQIEFKESLYKLAEAANVKLHSKKKGNSSYERNYIANQITQELYSNNLINSAIDSEIKKYLQKRKLTPGIIQKFGLGYATSNQFEITNLIKLKKYSKEELLKYGLVTTKTDGTYKDKFNNRLIFPIYNERGKIAGFSGRYIGQNNQKTNNIEPPKYLNSPETMMFKKSELFFGLNLSRQAISKKKFIILTEGQMNVISSHKIGVKNILAPMGTSLSTYQINSLKKMCNEIAFAYDNDTAGKNALIRNSILCYRKDINVSIITWDIKYGKDPDELINKSSKKWVESIVNRQDLIKFLVQSGVKALNNTELKKLENIEKLVSSIISSISNINKKQMYINYINKYLDISTVKYNKKETKNIINSYINTSTTKNDENLLVSILLTNKKVSKTFIKKIDKNIFEEKNKKILKLIEKNQLEDLSKDLELSQHAFSLPIASKVLDPGTNDMIHLKYLYLGILKKHITTKYGKTRDKELLNKINKINELLKFST